MKYKKQGIKIVCNRCGKEAPIDEEQSNENWKVYKKQERCECGGEFNFDFGFNEITLK